VIEGEVVCCGHGKIQLKLLKSAFRECLDCGFNDSIVDIKAWVKVRRNREILLWW
jgi:hypothetical protein